MRHRTFYGGKRLQPGETEFFPSIKGGPAIFGSFAGFFGPGQREKLKAPEPVFALYAAVLVA
jgi:hypothetical protein